MAKLVKCKTCGNMIASNAETCPQCGAKYKQSVGCCSGIIIIIVILVIIAYVAGNNKKSSVQANPQTTNLATTNSQRGTQNNHVLETRLAYLKTEIKELCRAEIIKNDVFISFVGDKLPDDFKIIANAAAVNGSKALVDANEVPSRCSVWIIPAEAKAGNVDRYFYNVNARHGKIY